MKRLLVALILVFFLIPGFVLAQDVPEEGPDTCVECTEPGGMVPCGRKCDDPMTDKNECLPCTLCDFFIMLDLFIDMSVKALTPIIVLLIIAIMALTVYLRSKSAPEKINKVKKALIGVVIGMAIILGAWVIINSILVALGVADWSDVNNLWIINCSPPEIEGVELVKTYCGDGKIQRPNNDEFIEICDGEDHGGKTCQNLGYESGDLTCLDDCSRFNESECVAYPPPAPLALPTLVPMYPEPLGPAPTGDNTVVILVYNQDGAGFPYPTGNDACIKNGYEACEIVLKTAVRSHTDLYMDDDGNLIGGDPDYSNLPCSYSFDWEGDGIDRFRHGRPVLGVRCLVCPD